MEQKGDKRERKELNKKQAINLWKDILNQQVKRFGSFIIGQYVVTVYNKVALTPIERTNKYYKLNPNKLVKIYDKKKKEYHKDKKEGICVRCRKRKALKNRVWCRRCKEINLNWHNERRSKKQSN